MGTKNRKNTWVTVPTDKLSEFLAAPNFKSLVLISAIGLMAMGASTQAFAADIYGDPQDGAYSSIPPLSQPVSQQEQNPNYLSTLSPAAGAFINDNAQLEESQPVIENDYDMARQSTPPQPINQYYTPEGDFVYGAGQRPR